MDPDSLRDHVLVDKVSAHLLIGIIGSSRLFKGTVSSHQVLGEIGLSG